MRIVGSKRDYYDCIQAHGQDQTLLYIRKPEEIHYGSRVPVTAGPVWPFPAISYWHYWDGFNVDQHIIGFCGKIYPMVSFRRYDPKIASVACFTIEDIDKFVDDHLSDDSKERYYGRPGKRRRWRYWGSTKRVDIVEHFNNCAKKQDDFRGLFEERRSPVFVATYSTPASRHGKIVYNELLRPYEFFRVFDPYRAFQEISMFMSNLAIPEKVMPVIPDELKIHSRGFNEWSFRRPPGGK